MLLYGTDNQPIHRHLAMTAAQVRALNDGQYFLAHGAQLLGALRLEPYCRVCDATGQDAHIRLTPGEGRVEFQCAHTAGHIRTDRRTEVPLLLDACKWGIRCSACQEPAAGDNSRHAKTFTITCRCTTRAIDNPTYSPLDPRA